MSGAAAGAGDPGRRDRTTGMAGDRAAGPRQHARREGGGFPGDAPLRPDSGIVSEPAQLIRPLPNRPRRHERPASLPGHRAPHASGRNPYRFTAPDRSIATGGTAAVMRAGSSTWSVVCTTPAGLSQICRAP